MEFTSIIPGLLSLVSFAWISLQCPVNADLYLPSPPRQVVNLELGDEAISKFVSPDVPLRPIGPVMDNTLISRFSDPETDKQNLGSPIFWRGLAAGGCGYGNQLDQNKYPYLMLASVSRSALKQLGFGPEHGVGCGACVEITCSDIIQDPAQGIRCPRSGAKVVAMIGDLLPTKVAESGSPEVDLFFGAWMHVMGRSTNPRVSMQRVVCPNPGTYIWMMVKENWGPQMFFKAVFQNVGHYGVLTRVDMACTDGNEWEMVSLENTYGAVFQTSAQPRFSSCQFHLYQEDGSKVTSKIFNKLGRGKLDDYPFVQQMDLGVQFASAELL